VSIYISRNRVGGADYSFTINVDTFPHHSFMLAITCLSVTSAKSDSPVLGMVTHLPLLWTELHLRPLEGVQPFPWRPVHDVLRCSALVQPVQVGAVTGRVPPGSPLHCGTRPVPVVIIAVLGGELSPGIPPQTVTWNDTVLHPR
jgi:hypothetical protein